jgi:predicted secreted protein/outer membrane lipoprotein-sorting protein
MAYRWMLMPVMAVVLLLAMNSGCVTDTPSDANLTPAELAVRYLDRADAIRDYRSEYEVLSGSAAENRSPSRIRFDYKAPSFARMERVDPGSPGPGTFATTNGSSTAWYNADTNTYDLTSGVNLSREFDYQMMVRSIVADRNFSVIERNTSRGTTRYLIEVATEPYSDIYTSSISSRIRAWIEPSTGLAWNIMTYYDCSGTGVPIPTPPQVDAVPPGRCVPSDVPNREIRYESIQVNTGIPDSYFEFVPPEGSGPRCVPKYVNYVEPPRTDTSVPIDQPLPGGVRYALNESDSGRTVTVRNGEVIEITLGEIPGLAYRWIMPTGGSGLELMNAGPIYEMPANADFLGGKGYYRWRFRAVSPGTETFDGIFALGGCDIQGAKRFSLTVEVTG